MSDKKLTDEEIIKALECCISTTTEEACAGCPFNKQKLFALWHLKANNFRLGRTQ